MTAAPICPTETDVPRPFIVCDLNILSSRSLRQAGCRKMDAKGFWVSPAELAGSFCILSGQSSAAGVGHDFRWFCLGLRAKSSPSTDQPSSRLSQAATGVVR